MLAKDATATAARVAAIECDFIGCLLQQATPMEAAFVRAALT
jgi:hypothetical protein